MEEFSKAEEAINSFKQENPDAWIYFCEKMDKFRNTRFDQEFATAMEGKGDYRHVAKFPSDSEGNNLFDIIEMLYPGILENEKQMERFLIKFPEFKVPEKI